MWTLKSSTAWNSAHCSSVFRSCMVEESGTLESQLEATKVSAQSALTTPEPPARQPLILKLPRPFFP